MDDLHHISQEEFERIEAYLNGSLSEEDLSSFEVQLKNEEGFASKVEDIKTVLIGIETQSLKAQLDRFHDEAINNSTNASNSETKVRSLNLRRIAVAAALIIAAGSFWFLTGNSNERLYAKYYSPDPGLPTTMGDTDNYEFYEAMVSYKQGNYKDALKTWKDQLNTKTKNDTLNYFVGSALLASKQEKEALSYLLEVTKQDHSTFKNEALYYLGLAYLKSDNKEKAIEYLKKSNATQAKDLLNKLD
ncbi:tetratricopeptide repeat protein [Winogradskyella tangerina]|uniref:tetratricopeptide repeat protein n=1 Tax=Winogradskyella tangerina TaxID=2023240 RepID=UPI000DBE6370|nr:hypothetical protein [Winogradskyella tangerina]